MKHTIKRQSVANILGGSLNKYTPKDNLGKSREEIMSKTKRITAKH